MKRVLDIDNIAASFIGSIDLKDIYNEFSLQHELGIYLREHCKDYKVQFERNVSFFDNIDSFKRWTKHEIDIVIYNEDMSEKYAIELKYPRNGQYPEQMFKFIEDICFMEEVKKHLNFTGTYTLTMVEDKAFYQGQGGYIYSNFREDKTIKGKYNHPTGKNKDYYIKIDGQYKIDWKSIDENHKYYFVVVQ